MALRYLGQGLHVFAALTFGIPAFAGFSSFMYRRTSWTPVQWFEDDFIPGAGLDRHGATRPDMKDLVLSCLQIKPVLTAWGAVAGTSRIDDWDLEKAFAGAFEGCPSALLQTYAWLCVEQTGGLQSVDLLGLLVQAASILSSLKSMAEAANIVALRLLPASTVSPTDQGLSANALLIWRVCDVGSRIWLLALFGICSRPAGTDIRANKQWQLFALLGVEVAISALILRFTLRVGLRGLGDKYLLVLASSSVGLPLMTFPVRKWVQQQAWQLSCLMLRNFETTLVTYAVWLRCHIYTSEPHVWLLSYSFAAIFFNVLVTGTVLCSWWRLRQRGEPLFPASDVEDFHPVHWAAALGLPHLLQGADHPAMRLSDGSVPAHLAAECGHEAALRVLQDLAPGSLSAADNDGQLPAHAAAYGGQEAALRVLQESQRKGNCS